MPSGDELVDSTTAAGKDHIVVLSGVDPRFDQKLLTMMRQAEAGETDFVYVSALSRFSRDSAKLLRILDFLLAHGVRVLTTNMLLRAEDVWVRRKHLLKPVSEDPMTNLRKTEGLVGAHRATVQEFIASRSDDAASRPR